MNRIFPRNLTAQAAMQIAGNPATTRLESGVSNCFPGLEFDHRNLDRRFFPGLIFEFVTTNDTPDRAGARRTATDLRDEALAPPGDTLPDGSPADPVANGTPIDWLRSDRSPDRTGAAA